MTDSNLDLWMEWFICFSNKRHPQVYITFNEEKNHISFDKACCCSSLEIMSCMSMVYMWSVSLVIVAYLSHSVWSVSLVIAPYMSHSVWSVSLVIVAYLSHSV